MELGNMMFGHSRGEWPVPRTNGFEGPMWNLCEEATGDPTPYEDFENEIFILRPYNWGDPECSCGFEGALNCWESQHFHGPDCYQIWLRQFPSYKDTDAKSVERECKKRGLPYPEGSAVHCDCGYQKAWVTKYEELGGHRVGCELTLPNFEFKPGDFSLMWYKHPLRDSYANKKVTKRYYRDMIDLCLESLKKPRVGCSGIWLPVEKAYDFVEPGQEALVYERNSRDETLPPLIAKTSYHPDAGFCVDELRESVSVSFVS